MSTLQTRRNSLHQNLHEDSLLVLFSGEQVKRSADSNYPFSVNRNFYYLLQLDEDELIYCVHKKGNHVFEALFIKDANPVEEKWVGKSINKEEASQISGIKNILFVSQFESYITRILSRNVITTLYVDYERLNLKHQSSEGERYARELRTLFPCLNQINVNPLINAQRSIKSEEELSAMRAAIETTHRALDRVVTSLKPGRFEYEVAADFHHQLHLENSYPSFSTIAASGKDATILHYISNHKVLKDGELLLMDCGASHQHYCADITRTFPINGRFTERQKTFYNIVLEAQMKVIEAIKPGCTLAQLNEMVKRHYQEACVRHEIIDQANQVDEVYYHSVSHFLGLDTHDVGAIEGIQLTPGMVVTVEPGLYSAKEGIGIRIEDDILVTQDGSINLSSAIPKTIDEIEAWFLKDLS